ncbi:coiled-coil domain-containing protein 174-like isoform X1 [Portunus trituberculatus]|uniref:coiled-coil domain-containing protein 174-like isoform X1 n=2 Tax=Portunus trituberculatus TaxID=210409 RepID=UPI001E1CD1AE|nr:coiled-coil domain-containing protein 174-like isoform X1 [Portunus trituberculatus]XP_045123375.1 coiled-coil domain-containing protein 174-like isoform X1 [Portunus trituberculatus]
MESGLVGLRAELQKKRAEASKFGTGQRGAAGREKEAARPKASSASNPGVASRAARDEEQHQAEQRNEEKSRNALERKAAMYDKIQQGIEVLENDNLNQRFLVNFQKKIIDDVMTRNKTREDKEKTRKQKQQSEEVHHEESNADDDNEWVEYTDAFGRTRECRRAELSEKLEQDKQLSQDLNPSETEEKTVLDPLEVEDLHREALHQKWQAEEEANATKKDLHYQDILYDEARTHGPGFLKFSRNEKERKAQMELLRDLQTEAQRATATTAAAANKRQKAMKTRLEKVRQRKRLKMGLPMKDDDKLKTPPGSEEEEEQIVGPAPLPPSPPPRKKVGGVREWDLGKEGVTSTLTQEEWVLRQRSQRSQEFAPPSSYHPKEGRSQATVSSSYQHQATGDQLRRDSHSPPPDPKEPLREERRPEFAPPATHEYYGPMTSRRTHHKTAAPDIEAAISKGLSHLRKMNNY